MVSDFRPHESYQFFLQEAPDLLRSLEEGLLGLRQEHSISAIWELMRIAHSIKGGAACVGLDQIQQLAHRLETAFKALSAEASIAIDLELEDLLLRAFDCLRSALLQEIETGQSHKTPANLGSPTRPAELQPPEPIWAMLQAKLQPAQPSHVPPFLFAAELEKGLLRLAAIRDSPSAEQIEALKTQLEIFKGIGEISQLSGLKSIAHTSLTALNLNPTAVQAIAQIVQTDFQAAQAAILEGDRTQGGAPSPALLQWTQPRDPASAPILETPPSSANAEQTSPVSQPRPASDSRFAAGTRPDWTRLDSLSNLVSELATQSNRSLAYDQQHEETLQAIAQSFDRFRQLTLSLSRWASQQHPETSPNRQSQQPSPQRSQQRSQAQNRRSHSFLQTTTQAAAEELAHLGEAIQDLTLLEQQGQQLLKQRHKTLKQVQTNLLQARMLPIGELLSQFPRMVRDLATREGKQVKLTLKGTQTLVDKAILEKLYDPLVHLLRNAFDHGIESPEVRQAIGKPPEANITIRAWHRGNHTYIEVKDDGQGIDLEKIRATAIATHWLSPTEAAMVSSQRLYEYLFAPAFSTATEVSQISGRGIGLYAVRSQLSLLKGNVTVDSNPGTGTIFTLRLPLTLTVTKLLIFSLNRHLFAIAIDRLAAVQIASAEMLQIHQNQPSYYWKDQFVPLYPESLLSAYRYPLPCLTKSEIQSRSPASDPTEQAELPTDRQSGEKFPLLLLEHSSQVVALKVDRIVTEQELVIKPFNEAIDPPPYLNGCTVLGDGRLAPVLDSAALIERWLHFARSQTQPSAASPAATLLNLSTILVVDDSVTIRQTLSLTLQKAGYRVVQARDGWEAIAQLQLQPGISAVICDIEMPRMNGLEFLSRCRQQSYSQSHSTSMHLMPIIILTYRSSEKYRQLAQQLGATHYLTKPFLDKELLSVLETCLKAQS